MGILDDLLSFLELLVGQIINVPLQNPLSYLYVILNILLLVFGTLAGG